MLHSRLRIDGWAINVKPTITQESNAVAVIVSLELAEAACAAAIVERVALAVQIAQVAEHAIDRQTALEGRQQPRNALVQQPGPVAACEALAGLLAVDSLQRCLFGPQLPEHRVHRSGHSSATASMSGQSSTGVKPQWNA